MKTRLSCMALLAVVGAASAARAQTPNCEDDVNVGTNRVYIQAADTQVPLLKALGVKLRAQATPITIIYTPNGSCSNISYLGARDRARRGARASRRRSDASGDRTRHARARTGADRACRRAVSAGRAGDACGQRCRSARRGHVLPREQARAGSDGRRLRGVRRRPIRQRRPEALRLPLRGVETSVCLRSRKASTNRISHLNAPHPAARSSH